MIEPLIVALTAAQDPITREGARDAARRELSKRIYHRDDPSWIERLISEVFEFFGRLLSRAATVTPGGPAGLILIVVIVVVLVIAARLGLGPLRARDLLTDRRRGTRALSAADYRAQAETLAHNGAWKDAIRARFRAVIRELEERGVLDPRPGRTAGEIAREGGAVVPAIAAPLRTAADVFDEVWYGDRPATEAGYRRVSDVDDAVRGTRLTAAGQS